MKRFKFKINSKAMILIGVLCAACLTGFGFTVANLAYARVASEYFSAIFLMCVMLLLLGIAVSFFFASHYTVTPAALIVRTSLFREKISYANILRSLLFASENELYLELAALGKHDAAKTHIIRVHIEGESVHDFLAALRGAAPDIPCEISLKSSLEE